MSDTTIYFVEIRTEDQAVAVCRWVEHFYDQGRRVQVLAGSAPAAQNLDQLLWTFAQGSFIPHRIVSSIPVGVPVEPVLITPGEIPLDGFAVLVCDGVASYDFLLRYQVAVHFVHLDDAEKRQDSRLLWQQLRDHGMQTIHVPHVPKGKTPFS
jgi:DNA polymerase III subunit chi